MVVGQPAWHKLGVNVEAALDAQQAITLAALNWSVTKRAASYRKADGTHQESRSTFLLVRDDTEAELGAVGSRYEPIQNAEAFAFLDSVIG